ncbi:amidohydrolase family protein [Leucobacter salsicius]|uniref:amidohydrolase family protein n=1 Tax=Leucobacter salsicius TaxID=664638 RepID=UPI00034634FF|nr:amidohydrolase family protein [Leucobacter salsicius]
MDAAESTGNADLVMRGGAVLVMDAAASRASSVAVRAGHIIAVGSDAEVDHLVGETTRVIDLAGRAVLPGINDSHLHGSWLGARWPHTFFGGDPAVEQPTGALVSTRAERRAAIGKAGQLLTELGITSYTEPGIGPGEDSGETGCFHSEVIDIYRELADAGKLSQRVTLLALYGVLDGPSDVDVVVDGIRSCVAQGEERDPRWFAIPGVKIFGDLIPLSRQAWTSHAYDDGTHGTLLVNGDSIEERAEGLAAMVREAHLAGLQVGLHATGDLTIDLALDAIAVAEREPGAPAARDLGHVIIHGDLVTPAQLKRMAELGVWLNTQAGIAAQTNGWLAGMLGEQVAAQAWPLAAAIDAGVLVLSSDSPVLGFDWRVGVADADARILATQAGSGGGEEGSGSGPTGDADARLHALLRAYTAVPAAQDRADAWKGTVEVGKVADLVVLERDPFDVGAAGLPGVAVDMTVLDGRVVFER